MESFYQIIDATYSVEGKQPVAKLNRYINVTFASQITISM
jgi:hypothetical protein